MRRRWTISILVAVVVAVAGTVGYRLVTGSQERLRAELQRQLDLARKEGLSTTWSEYVAAIKPAKPSENAAPLYRQIVQTYKSTGRDWLDLAGPKLERDVLLHPTSAHFTTAETHLREFKDVLSLVDKASALPRCWFNRDWLEGGAVTFTEFQYMRAGARLIGLRGSLAAARGNPDSAIHNAREMIRIASHATEEQSMMAYLVGGTIREAAVKELEDWAFLFPKETKYKAALNQAVEERPMSDYRLIRRDQLLTIRQIVKESTTPQGRADLGIKESEVSRMETWASLLNRTKADIKIVEVERKINRDYGEAPAAEDRDLHADYKELIRAMAPYPTAAQFYLAITEGEVIGEFLKERDEAKHLCDIAITRALTGPTVAKRIKTSDLLSPFDGKPIQYKFDGRQITVTVSCPINDEGIIGRKLPTDAELSIMP